MEDVKLERCPFCNYPAILKLVNTIEVLSNKSQWENTTCYVSCTNCEVRTKEYGGWDRASQAWNARWGC